MEYKVSIATDKGTVKEVNQDSTMVKVASSDKIGRIVMGVLCDGMGGLSHGEVASAMMVERLETWFSDELPSVLGRINVTERLDETDQKTDLIADIRREWMAIAARMNNEILQYGYRSGAPLGTTAVCFLMIGQEFIVMNIGDSRAYMITDDAVQLLTHDQSVVQDMMDRGLMTREEAEISPQRSVLLQCIGASGSVVPQFVRGYIAENTSILLCSDGFWRKLESRELEAFLSPSRCPDEEDMKRELGRLVGMVKEREETDNISAVLIKCML
ncbi:MAG: protein phosphatase 2C domain-containing protein [Butyrivibrio sp.]|nr:protein phosphatase 2C domain-containing protein [Butyrivibrio sp.]